MRALRDRVSFLTFTFVVLSFAGFFLVPQVSSASPSQYTVTSQSLAAAQVSGEFVGSVLGAPSQFVAVNVDASGVRAYLCDGRSMSEWWVGPASGSSFDLTNDGRMRIAGNVTESGATGRITFPDGSQRPFGAARAQGKAGLYNVEVREDGTFNGASMSGVKVSGSFRRETPTSEIITATQFEFAGGENIFTTLPATGARAGLDRWVAQEVSDVIRGSAADIISVAAIQLGAGVPPDGSLFKRIGLQIVDD